jgi:hypothetical protein
MQVIARSSQAACQSFFIERRVGSEVVRRSTALRLTCAAATQSKSIGIPGLRFSVETIDISFKGKRYESFNY